MQRCKTMSFANQTVFYLIIPLTEGATVTPLLCLSMFACQPLHIHKYPKSISHQNIENYNLILIYCHLKLTYMSLWRCIFIHSCKDKLEKSNFNILPTCTYNSLTKNCSAITNSLILFSKLHVIEVFFFSLLNGLNCNYNPSVKLV